ncbi:MAG TPA: hypothetical protein VMW16_06760 [Sedimentisphaerales bacterium]|nr:hypothetical protein [Sedimentisphaerales bacterium]
MSRWVGWVIGRTRIAAQHHAIGIIRIAVVDSRAIRSDKLPCRAMAVIEQVPGAVCRVILCYYIIADGLGNIRMAAQRRPPLQNLRLIGVVVGIDW